MKQYEKPKVYIEYFELSQSVAACGWDINSANKETCAAYSDPDIVGGENPGDWGAVFTETTAGCTITDYEQYCYQPGAGTEASKVFTS